MKVGRDVKLPSPLRDQADAQPCGTTVLQHLERAAAAGLDGVLLRTIHEVSPTLDSGLLAEVRACADDLSLYLELGVGKVNPYMTAELPEIRDLGDGSYLEGMVRMITAARDIGCVELWTATAFQKPSLPGIFVVDRFRTDVRWSEQLRATEGFLRQLAPVLRDLGCHLNLETHEEITSWELLRLVEAVGPDVVGITFDSANVVVQGEHPAAAAARVAPWVRQTHLRDVAMFDHPGGQRRYLTPCGSGVLDWSALVRTLLAGNPDLHLTIEGAGSHRGGILVPLEDPRWHASHDDLGSDELAATVGLAGVYAGRVDRGEAPDEAAFVAGALGDVDEFILRSSAFLRTVTA